LTIAFLAVSLCSAFASESMIKRKIFSTPEVVRLTESQSRSLWGHNIFASPEAIGVSYVVDIPDGILFSSAFFVVDSHWDRMVYRNDPDDGCIHAYGQWGEDNGPYFRTPSDIEVFAPQSETSIWTYYKIFVADWGNHRVKRLDYNWYTGQFTDLAPIEDIAHPRHLAYHNGGTFDDLTDDRIWVLDATDRLLL